MQLNRPLAGRAQIHSLSAHCLKLFKIFIFLGWCPFLSRIHILVGTIYNLHHLLQQRLVGDLYVHVPPFFWSLGLVFLGSKRSFLIVCHFHEFSRLSYRTPIRLWMGLLVQGDGTRVAAESHHGEIVITRLIDLPIIIILWQISCIIVLSFGRMIGIAILLEAVHRIILPFLVRNFLRVRICTWLIIVWVVSLVTTVVSSWLTRGGARIVPRSFSLRGLVVLVDGALHIGISRIIRWVLGCQRLLVWMRVCVVKCYLPSLDKSAILGLPVATVVIFVRQLRVDGFGACDSVGNLHLLGLSIAWVSLVFIILVVLESGSLRLSLNLPYSRDRFSFLVILVQSLRCHLGSWLLLYLSICGELPHFILDVALFGFMPSNCIFAGAFTSSLRFRHLSLLLLGYRQDSPNWRRSPGGKRVLLHLLRHLFFRINRDWNLLVYCNIDYLLDIAWSDSHGNLLVLRHRRMVHHNLLLMLFHLISGIHLFGYNFNLLNRKTVTGSSIINFLKRITFCAGFLEDVALRTISACREDHLLVSLPLQLLCLL